MCTRLASALLRLRLELILRTCPDNTWFTATAVTLPVWDLQQQFAFIYRTLPAVRCASHGSDYLYRIPVLRLPHPVLPPLRRRLDTPTLPHARTYTRFTVLHAIYLRFTTTLQPCLPPPPFCVTYGYWFHCAPVLIYVPATHTVGLRTCWDVCDSCPRCLAVCSTIWTTPPAGWITCTPPYGLPSATLQATTHCPGGCSGWTQCPHLVATLPGLPTYLRIPHCLRKHVYALRYGSRTVPIAGSRTCHLPRLVVAYTLRLHLLLTFSRFRYRLPYRVLDVTVLFVSTWTIAAGWLTPVYLQFVNYLRALVLFVWNMTTTLQFTHAV